VPNGRLVVHVGTTDVSVDRSNDVKRAWRELASNKLQLRGFNPARNVGLVAEQNSNEHPGPDIWGLVTTDVRLFALKVYRQTNNNSRYRIARVELQNSLTESQLRQWDGGV